MRGSILLAVMALLIGPLARAEVVGQADKEVRAIAEPILETVLAGFEKGDYTLYFKHFSESLRKAIPEERFLQVS